MSRRTKSSTLCRDLSVRLSLGQTATKVSVHRRPWAPKAPQWRNSHTGRGIAGTKGAMGKEPKGIVARSDRLNIVKRTISAAGKKRIAAAQRARWARVKAGKKKAG
jgi:hypothetical protein